MIKFILIQADFIEKNLQSVPVESNEIIQNAMKAIGFTDVVISSKGFQLSSNKLRNQINCLLETLKNTVR